ncbi:MAG: hypothetical protein H6732_14070 [Alphaproteobacteria bacterium]|nr:hypothetical protein [Alphaproteobacteria bacterium]
MSTPSRDGTSLAVMFTSLAVGLLGGVFVTWVALVPNLPDEPVVVEIPREYAPSELQIVCLPYMRQTAETLEEAQTKVTALELRVREKEAEINRLEAEVRTGADVGEDGKVRLEEARAQLDSLEAELASAVAEKTELLRDLARTREALAGTRMALAATEARVLEVREEKLEERWLRFVQNAQLTICEDGTAERLLRCRDQVSSALEPYRLRFKQCVRSNQATPEVRKARRPDEVPEGFGVWLDRDLRDVRDWYVLFCDPLLPEAEGPD